MLKPGFSVEHSLSQVVLRTGLTGKDPRVALTCHDHASKAMAIKKAKMLVEKEVAKRGA